MVGKRLVNTGVAAAAALDPFQNFETVTYTGNGDTQKITGYIRKGASFNGSSSKIETNIGVFNTTTYSVSFWFNVNAYKNASYNHWPFIINNDQHLVIGENPANTLKIYFSDFSTSNAFYTITDPTAWYNVVVTRSGNSISMYVNGTLANTFSYTGMSQGTSFKLGVNHANNAYLDGKLDQVRVFDKVLSTSEVTTLYGETYASSTKSTTDIFSDGSAIALYELDDSANDTGIPIDDGQSASFIGTNQNYIQLPSGIDTILNTKNFGLSFWVKAPNATTDAVFSTETTNSTFQIHANWAHAGSYSLINGGGSNINLGAVDSNWHHIVVTSDGSSSYKGYFDKSYKGASAYRQTSNVGTFLGAHPGGGFNLLGEIDQVRIFNRQLSQSDIDDLYNETAPTTVDYFGDGNGKALYTLNGTPDDESGSYDATWNGTAAYSDPALLTQYNGTATNVNYLGMAFQPDLVWTKSIAGLSWWHFIQDSVRGTTSAIYSNNTEPAGTFTDAIQSFDSNGYTIGSTGSLNWDSSNEYVAWCWKAGGAVVTNTDGSINSQVSANQDAGFSIVSWTGTGAINTVGHGIDTPQLILIKCLGGSDWQVYSEPTGNGNKLALNESSIASATTRFDSTSPTSSVFTFRDVGFPSQNFIAYCFHSVDGYQKIGSYTGTGVAGNTVTTGFQPRFVIIKSSSTTSNWVMVDSVRGDNRLLANGDNTEAAFTGVSFQSNGFTLESASYNDSAQTFIYLAIA